MSYVEELRKKYAEVRQRLNPSVPTELPVRRVVVDRVTAKKVTVAVPPAITVKPSPMHRLVALVTLHYGVSEQNIRRRMRGKKEDRARKVLYWLLREELGLTFPCIGHLFYRDHTSVMHGHHNVRTDMRFDPEFAAEVEGLRQAFKELLAGDQPIGLST